MVLSFSHFQNATLIKCPFSDAQRFDSTGAPTLTEEYSFTDTSFTTTSFQVGPAGNSAPAFREFDGSIDIESFSHVMKKIVYTGTPKPADEFGNDLDVYVCLTCGYRMEFYASTSRTTLGIAP